ncbi:anti-repressor SinI family protein [Peribacillus sp. JNUCC 23]
MNKLDEEIDQEWLVLMVEAKKMGLSIQEVRKFITKNPQHNSQEGKLESI